MKSSHTLASVLLLGSIAAIGACAEGAAPESISTNAADPRKTTEPTEPEESVTVPPKGTSSGDVPAPEEEDSGESSSGSTTSSSGSTTSSSGSTTSSSSGSTTSSSGSTTSSSSGSTTSSSSSGGVDAGSCVTVAPSNVCGLTPQCGCAANQTCDVTTKSNGSVSCVLAGGGPQGSLCTTSTQCAVGLTCAYGACRPYCATANTACTGAGLGQCGQLYDPPGTAVPNAKVCTITCDLRAPSAACGSNTCIWDSGVNATDCDAAGTKDLYDPCASYNDCKQGMACVNHPLFGYECEKWCRVGTNSDCGVFETCEDTYGAAAPMQGTTKLGHCQ